MILPMIIWLVQKSMLIWLVDMSFNTAFTDPYCPVYIKWMGGAGVFFVCSGYVIG